MLHPALAALPWPFVAAPNGIVQNAASTLALGAVMLIQRQDGQIVFARKARRPGYAFSRLLVLPVHCFRLRQAKCDPKASEQEQRHG